MSSNSRRDKILILAVNPIDTSRLRLDEEVREITEGLNRSKQRGNFTIESRGAVRPDDIRRAIFDCEPRIVHISGHGKKEGGLAFEDSHGNVKNITPEALAGLFNLVKDRVQCVVINACHSHKQADAIAQHIDYVIGMKQEIGDKAAIKYAIGFYDALGAGQTIDVAHKFGVNALELEGIPEEDTPIIRTKVKIDCTSNTNVVSNNELRLNLFENQFNNASNDAVEVFFSYAHEDEKMRNDLEKHLSLLKRQGIITGWHDRKISAGREWNDEIDTHLNTAKVILLLISSAFMASDYCWDVEVRRAMERHEKKEARVIPIILKPTDWKSAPFARLQALPKDAKAITKWGNRDEAFANVAQGIRSVVRDMISDHK
ncbi:TIR domain-containing protein [Calothrix sp. 336/3]|uniref:TIR domain-containing protein n=1 Tax=Calothrix sp. 336/3 TaxID=1337936 RepID=UPI0005540CDB|nr:TIR domain-containing protein [Calothrix sp. 336/3]AKG23906.1 TIR domain-containing protein [Calothrix sp. 336/3]